MAGSNHLRRTQPNQGHYTAETADADHRIRLDDLRVLKL
jgi:hypothetical protein